MPPLARVYVETSVLSYLASRPSRDLRVAAHQQMTVEWWEARRPDFELFVSQLVIREASAGDPDAAARRLELLHEIPLLALTDASLRLAERLLSEDAVPRGSEEDALHIAVAAVHGVDYLLTWNFKHIANATLRSRIAAVCGRTGYRMPVICTPEELVET